MKKLSIVIPVYNEEKTVSRLIQKIAEIVLPHGITKEIIVVDDASRDGTRAEIEKYATSKVVELVSLDVNKGKGGAVKEGLRKVTGDYVIIQDADLEYDPENYKTLIDAVTEKDAQVVFGSRNINERNQPVGKMYLYGGIVLTKIFDLMFKTSLTDIHTCYKLFPREAVDGIIHCPNNRFTFDAVELTHFLAENYKVKEVPITYVPRDIKAGKKIKFRDGVSMLWRMTTLWLGLDSLFARLRYKEALPFVKKGGEIADIGSGPSMNFLRYIRKDIKRGVGIDRRFVKSSSLDNLELIAFDFDTIRVWPMEENQFDQAFALALIEHVDNPDIVAENAYRIIKKGGIFALTTPTPFSKPILEFLAFIRVIDKREIDEHKHYFTKKELKDLLSKAGFTEIKHSYFELGCNHFVVATK